MVDLSEIQAAYYMVAETGVLVAAGYYVLRACYHSREQDTIILSSTYSNW